MQPSLDRGFGYKNSQTGQDIWSPGIRTQDAFRGLQLATSSAEVGECENFPFTAILFP
jgi:hypothetical protein